MMSKIYQDATQLLIINTRGAGTNNIRWGRGGEGRGEDNIDWVKTRGILYNNIYVKNEGGDGQGG